MGRKITAALTLAAVCMASPGAAAIIMNIWEDGGSVHVQARGTLNLGGSVTQSLASGSDYLSGGAFLLGDGPDANLLVDSYMFAISGAPSQIGGLGFGVPTSSTGTDFGMSLPVATTLGNTIVYVDQGFANGSAVSTDAVFDATTIAALNLTPGSYVFDLPSDTITIDVGSAPDLPLVPLPAGAPLLAAGLGLLGWLGRQRRRC